MYDRPPPTAKHTIAIITVVIIVINLYINKKTHNLSVKNPSLDSIAVREYPY